MKNSWILLILAQAFAENSELQHGKEAYYPGFNAFNSKKSAIGSWSRRIADPYSTGYNGLPESQITENQRNFGGMTRSSHKLTFGSYGSVDSLKRNGDGYGGMGSIYHKRGGWNDRSSEQEDYEPDDSGKWKNVNEDRYRGGQSSNEDNYRGFGNFGGGRGGDGYDRGDEEEEKLENNGGYTRGDEGYNRGSDGYIRGDEDYSRSLSGYNRGDEEYNRHGGDWEEYPRKFKSRRNHGRWNSYEDRGYSGEDYPSRRAYRKYGGYERRRSGGRGWNGDYDDYYPARMRSDVETTTQVPSTTENL